MSITINAAGAALDHARIVAKNCRTDTVGQVLVGLAPSGGVFVGAIRDGRPMGSSILTWAQIARMADGAELQNTLLALVAEYDTKLDGAAA